jgi:hypothetical protein
LNYYPVFPQGRQKNQAEKPKHRGVHNFSKPAKAGASPFKMLLELCVSLLFCLLLCQVPVTRDQEYIRERAQSQFS